MICIVVARSYSSTSKTKPAGVSPQKKPTDQRSPKGGVIRVSGPSAELTKHNDDDVDDDDDDDADDVFG